MLLMSPVSTQAEYDILVKYLMLSGMTTEHARMRLSGLIANASWWAVEAHKRGVNPFEGVFTNDGSSGT